MMDRCECGNLATYHVRGVGYVCDLHVARKTTNWRQNKWLKNQQLSQIPFICLIDMLKDRETPLPLMHKTLNDIETSINLSYTDIDAGETP